MESTNYTSFNDWLENTKMPNGKRKVLQSAVKLFSVNGYNSTSTASIAKDCGLSEATVFKHFKSKKDLLKTIIDPLVNNLAPSFGDQFVSSVKGKALNINTMIEFIISNRFHFIEENHEVIFIVMNQILTDDKLRDKFGDIVVPKLKVVINKLTVLMAADDKISDDITTEELYRIIASQLLISTIQEYKFPSDDWDTEKQIKSMVKMTQRAIRK
ncbi:TetR/AcrR family transcriptional regulator [Apilactobacillus bombintestini]|uniref:TetR/AcrR family transcriptional regulator n=1 Tax=Apilactobacillus bombintestini TaxID=2419772 RepID=A0A387ASX2_9LACO|nr:TetR/AcrR family transcriptional regulator [Apilactobacillus bombintestini]AYF93057.1 TetR/AcrR family transcriptional regulator [Apilactobacillus bombintestini]